ncbi:MAG: DNA mismatch repair endonuclease MutL [Verrucomicrobiota bacterium]|nr:DNA mismatch repair endonuclease MutL [Verrucomicrobiota bacterium]
MPEPLCVLLLATLRRYSESMVSPPHILVLSDHIVNKIAAGEVVERPASVVKELMENAIDAGASQVDVEIVEGGRKLVAARDNGSGMSRDDALLSIERHATSKIRDVDDIERIATLGFRGEALAAIASVSRFRLITCARGETVGTEIRVTGGKLQDVRDIGAPAGASVEVRDLFFNVPVRRKFLRSQPTELSHLRGVFIVQALAHPDRGMSLRVDGAEICRLAAGSNLEDRIRELFGREYLSNLRPLRHEAGDVRISGHVSLPSMSRSDRTEQFIFVNGRATTAALIAYAIREGYHTLLAADRQPSVFLFVALDPGLVDVNAHPTKKEVRFRRPSEVRDAVVAAIRLALGSPGLQAVIRPEAWNGVPRAKPPAQIQLAIENLPAARAFQYPRLPPLGPAAGRPGGPETGGVSAGPDAATGVAGRATAPWSWCRVVGQIGGLYVLLETEDGFVVMDPHAAHERVLFERFMAEVTGRRVQTQGLLTPETVEFQPQDAQRVRKRLELLREMGFGLSEFGGDAFLVDALPTCLAEGSARAILIEIARSLEVAGPRGGKGRWQEEAIAQAACKSAFKARDKLNLAEIEKLVVDLALAEMPYTCPHGRPTLIFTSFHELNRRFGRE